MLFIQRGISKIDNIVGCNWAWFPIVFARVNVGLFFSISGYNKLFVDRNRAIMFETIVDAGIPFPEFSALFVAAVEFVVGAMLAAGFITLLSVIPLFVICVVATFTQGIQGIPQGLGPLDWYDWFLYLPEVLLALLLFSIALCPNPLSLDSLFLRISKSE